MTTRPTSAIALLMSVFGGLGVSSSSAEDAVRERLRAVIAANSLVEPGKTPFHLQMSFRYYDLQGRPGDAGLLEEWWTAPDTYLVTVAIPSVNQGKPTPLADAPKMDPREEYTLLQLLNAETDPVSGTYAHAPQSIGEFQRRVGKIDLSCFGPAESQTDVCIDPEGNGIRLRTMGKVVAMRNSLGHFEKTHVASDVAIAYGGIPASVGHLEMLKVLDPAQSAVVIPQHPPDSLKSADSTGIVRGKLLKHVDAEPPFFRPDLKGSVTPPLGTWNVLVTCRIMKDGTTSHIFALNSPGPTFTQSAIDAVSKYQFEPSLFEGKPVETSIEVEINFQRY